MHFAILNMSLLFDFFFIIKYNISIQLHVSFYHLLQALFCLVYTHLNLLFSNNHSILMTFFELNEMALLQYCPNYVVVCLMMFLPSLSVISIISSYINSSTLHIRSKIPKQAACLRALLAQ